MIIIQQTQGSSLSNLVVDEVTFQEETGLTTTGFLAFEYDGNDWELTTVSPAVVVDLQDYGISFSGTPVSTDIIVVAYQPSGADMYYFSPGKGINSVKINANFANLQQQTNDNETAITAISNTALLKDGSNITQTMVNEFNTVTPNMLTGNGNVNVTDNSVNFLTLAGNSDIILPVPLQDSYSHTIIIIVAGSLYSLGLGTSAHLLQNSDVDTTIPYSVMYIYNKIDNLWYYCLTQ